MNILHILNSASGGATIGALELMRTSREHNSGIQHFAVYPGLLNSAPDPMIRATTNACMPIPMRWWNSKTRYSYYVRFLISMREAQLTQLGYLSQRYLTKAIHDWKIDLVHTNTAANKAGAIAARRHNLPHVWHIRERIGKNGFMKFPMSDPELVQGISNYADRVVGMSQYVAEIFHDHNYDADVVYDGVDSQLITNSAAYERGKLLRRQWGLSDNELLVAKVAAVTSIVKNHEVFIRAASLFQREGVRVAIIGALPRRNSILRRNDYNYYERLRRLASELGVEIIWTDNVSDIPAIMNAIDLMVHTCNKEGFGRVAIEAMIAGKPVIGPNSGGIKESIIHNQTGILVEPDHVEAFATAIDDLIRHSDKRIQFGQAGKKRAHEVFSPERHLAEMRAIYEEVLVEYKK